MIVELELFCALQLLDFQSLLELASSKSLDFDN